MRTIDKISKIGNTLPRIRSNPKAVEFMRNWATSHFDGFEDVHFESFVWALPFDIDRFHWSPMLSSSCGTSQHRGSLELIFEKAFFESFVWALPLDIDRFHWSMIVFNEAWSCRARAELVNILRWFWRCPLWVVCLSASYWHRSFSLKPDLFEFRRN